MKALSSFVDTTHLELHRVAVYRFHALVVERWRELTKLQSTYLVALPDALGADGRIHTTFSQTTAATGRLSSINPNLQNIPVRTPLGREIRAAFVAAPGHVLILSLIHIS